MTCYYDGFHGDLNETLFVGKVDDDTKLLVETAYDSLMAAVNEGNVFTCSFLVKVELLTENKYCCIM